METDAEADQEASDPFTGPVAQFGYQLRELRQKAGKTYAAIAGTTFYSKSAVHGVDQGHQLPSEGLLSAFVRACGEEPRTWVERRAAIAQEFWANNKGTKKFTPRELGLPAPDPTEATTPAEYNDALKRLREWSGHTFRKIEELTKDYPRRTPASTLCNAFQRGTLPAQDLVVSFVRAVGLTEAEQTMWLDVWDDLSNGHPVRRTPTWRRWGTGAQQALARRPEPAPDAPPPVQTLPYTPVHEIRDCVLIDGEWQSTGEPGPSAWSLYVRSIRRRLAAVHPTRRQVAILLVVLAVTMLLATAAAIAAASA